MHSFISSCPELVTDDVIRRLLPPLECALTLTGQYVTFYAQSRHSPKLIFFSRFCKLNANSANLKIVISDGYCFSIPSILKSYGAHLKPSTAMVRLRLYDVLSLLPPQTYEGTNFPHRYATLQNFGTFERSIRKIPGFSNEENYNFRPKETNLKYRKILFLRHRKLY